jgi:cytosine/adenosine deaminase-related metal-dependent hydrolase
VKNFDRLTRRDGNLHPVSPQQPPNRILRARVVLPVVRPSIPNGAVLISENRIEAVGPWQDFASRHRAEVVDMGDVVLMPGLVNAHCHLDYTNLAGQIPAQKSFTDWLKLITAAKAGWSYSEFAESWLHGARMLVRTGTTTVADIEAVPELLPEVWHSTALRVFSFLEMTGVKSRRDPRVILRQTLAHIHALPNGRCLAGLSPHAPYSTLPELLRLAAEAARKRNWRLTTHVAESEEEFEMFRRGRGEMFDWLRRNERDMSDCGLGSPIQHLRRQGVLGENFLAVHVNYLARDDAPALAAKKVSVVHCPRSHAYFRHRPFPLRTLLRNRINVCLGTDSLATVPKRRRQTVELNLFESMQTLAANAPFLAPGKILQMATINGARALGLSGQIGELSPGALADIIAIPFAGKMSALDNAVLHHAGDVSASMIDGQWAFRPAIPPLRLTSDE